MDQEYARLETQDGEQVVLEGVSATGELRGVMLEMFVEQRFRNPAERNIEVVYSFPLPWGAILLNVDVRLGGKPLTGIVVEKNQAETGYEEAISAGDAAILLEKNRDYSYCLNLGNLAAREDCVITLRYVQTLQYEHGGLRLLVPTVIAPRYGDAVTDGGLRPHQAPEYALLAEYPFDIELKLYGELAFARVASPSHPISVARSGTDLNGPLRVTLARHAALDRDFVLIIDQLVRQSLAISAEDCVETDKVAILASFCPRVQRQDTESANVRAKILIDCSGSMCGDSMEAAKLSLQSIIHQLDKRDSFSLSRFGNTVEHRSRGLWPVTEVTRSAAQRWVARLEADMGGTELEAALNSTFTLAQDGPTSDVLILTDGEIHAIEHAIASARASGHRLFIIGIGSSPAESHLRRLAEATGGACDFVAPGEAVGPAVTRMFSRLRSPRLTNLTIAWPGNLAPEWVSPLPEVVFDGDTINVWALLSPLLSQVPEGEVHLIGTPARGGLPEQIGCARFAPAIGSDGTLSRLVAYERLQAGKNGVDEISAASRRLAVAYQLITAETSFLLVHQRADAHRTDAMPDLYKVSQMMPAGWGGIGSVTFSRKNAYFETRVTEYQPGGSLDWGDFDAAGIRLAQKSSLFNYRPNRDAAAFQQRDHRDSRIIDHANSHYWSRSANYTGLTPLGLGEWLRIAPLTEWPETYVGLREIGLGLWLLDWLELAVAQSVAGPLLEHDVIKAFLHVISRWHYHEFSTKSAECHGLLPMSGESIPHWVSDNFAGDRLLAAEIADALKGMTEDKWPDQVYSMGQHRKESCMKNSKLSLGL